MENIYGYISDVVVIIGIIPLILFLVGLNEKPMEKSKIFLPFIILIFSSSIYEFFITGILKIDNAFWFKIYSVLEFYLLLFVFDRIFKKKARKILAFAAICYSSGLPFVFSKDNIHKLFAGEAYLSTFSSFLVIIGCFIWFNKYFMKNREEEWYKQTLFFFMAGLLLYFCGTYFLFLFSDLLMLSNNVNDFFKFWFINLTFLVVLRLSLIIGIWKEWKR